MSEPDEPNVPRATYRLWTVSGLITRCECQCVADGWCDVCSPIADDAMRDGYIPMHMTVDSRGVPVLRAYPGTRRRVVQVRLRGPHT